MTCVRRTMMERVGALLLLAVFLLGLVVAFTHIGAPISANGQIAPCPYAQLEGTCVSGALHHVELSQHLLNILPLTILALFVVLLLAYLHRIPKWALLRIFAEKTMYITQETSGNLLFLNRLFARGILNPRLF